ncbi:type VI secretion system membrane subunit TssM [Psychrobacter sp. FME13]|uniref:type VI secretion system membrane subunit TssM n=1 Tax=Psychrobacter sp. FME13 TaxID=2487708 RepID=UPI0017888D0B|nr:type VI secretion system membrane subunit TssM [Psychrobacter sp. FME13]MBE0441228.1 type VI secretion system membrane subunit TssM [Psychrobacter sp. FME13]
MRRLLSFASSKVFWVFLGLLGISLLIWFFGGIVAIGSYKPLESKAVRIAIIALIFLVWLTKTFLKQYLQARRNRELVEDIKTSQQPILKHVNKDSPLSRQFDEIDSVLKSAKFSNSDGYIKNKFFTGQYLYQMPWYVVLGAAGTGKTTALRESGLNFPLESTFGASISGLAGTKDCDWFLTDDAVLLDTAGRLSLQDNNEEDSYDWLEFISLLKKYRPRQPINGVVVTIGLDDILNPNTDFKNITRELRKRIQEMRAKLGINFPVYLMVTKLDILKGFEDFFSSLDEEQRKKYLGFTIPANDIEDDNGTATIGYVSKQLNNIRDNIESSYLRIIDDVPNQTEKDAIFTFSNEFSLLNERLILLFRELYKSSKFEEAVQWRGIFFTSAYQDGESMDPVFNNITSNFELTPKYIKDKTVGSQVTKSYFIHDLFTDVIFNDANLASNNRVWSTKNQILKWIGVGAIAGGVILASAFMFNSFLTNSQYLKDVNEKAISLDKELKDTTETKDLLQAVEMADKIRVLSRTAPFVDIDSPALKHRMGLYQGYAVDEISQAAYQRALNERVMPLISYKIDELLRQSPEDSSIDNYNALKAYLMLYDDTRFDAEFMLSWLMRSFEKDSSIQNAEQKQRIEQSLKFILQEEGLTPSLPLDTKLVDERRQFIARNDISIMILNDSFTEIARGGNKVVPVSFDTMGGKQSRLVFARASGKPLTEAINPIYTKQAYIEFVLPELLKSTAKLYEEEEWVLGNYASLKSSETDTLKEAKSAYFQRYISAWNRYIADIRLKQPRNLREARDIAKILSNTSNSPLQNIIVGISDNTTLDISKQIEGGETNGAVKDTVDRLISRAGFGNLQNKAGYVKDNYIDNLKFTTPVDEEFSEFGVLAEKQGSDQAAINEVVVSIKDLYEFLDILDVAVEKGVDLPSNDSLFRYRAEINRLPSPFRQMFDQFSVFILNQSLDEMNERLLKADIEAKRKLEEQRQREDDIRQEAEDKEEARRQEELALKEEQEVAKTELKKKQELEAFNSMKRELAPITAFCKGFTQDSYPFSANSDSEIKLTNFDKIFGTKGQYQSFMNLNPQVVNAMRVASFDELIRLHSKFRSEFRGVRDIEQVSTPLLQKGNGQLGFDFNVKVINVDPRIEKLIFNYGDKSYSYSHGPLESFRATWPKDSSRKVGFLAYINEKRVDEVETDGSWALLKLVEAGKTLINNRNKSVVRYSLDDKDIVIEFSAGVGNNPFYLADLRRFSCP